MFNPIYLKHYLFNIIKNQGIINSLHFFFSFQTFKTWCVFYIYSIPQFGLVTFQVAEQSHMASDYSTGK